MTDDPSFDINELSRRLANLIAIGKVTAVDYNAAAAAVTIGDLVTTWLPFPAIRAGNDRSWWAPEIGEQVLIACPSGDPANGIILCSLYQTAYPAPANTADKHRHEYNDGAVIEYDRAASHLDVVLPAGATVTLNSDGGITINGDITLTGNIDMTGTLTADVDVIANGISLVNHVHGGVQSGSGTTGVPQ